MELAGVKTLQQVIDEVTREVWRRRYPDRLQPDLANVGGDPELAAIRDAVRTAVLEVAQEETTPEAPLPALETEWEKADRLARIGAMAYVRTGF